MDAGGYTVTGVKTFTGMDVHGFNCTLRRDEKKIATAINDGSGGEIMVYWSDKEAEKRLDEFVKTLSPLEDRLESGEVVTMIFDANLFIEELVYLYNWEKTIKRYCKRKTLFRLKGGLEDEFRCMAIPWEDPKAKAYLTEKYGDRVVEIANKRFQQEAT